MAKKKFNTNNLVIICEGTETEWPYFEYIKNKVENNFDDIKVLPNPDDKDTLHELCRRENRKLKKIAHQPNGLPKKYPLYVTLVESENDVDANYNKYKRAPAKYVREAYLWLKEGYSEAWAVYDLDDTDDPDHSVHQCAKELKESLQDLYIAFSAYSFEEWILLNFERCATAFRHSACKSKNAIKEDSNCNGRSCHYKSRCIAECIGDYLTRQGHVAYIRDKYPDPQTIDEKGYSKKDGKSFARAICEDEKLRRRAYINAAWSRSLNNGIFYDCNPYSDVDKLVMRLLGEKIDIKWVTVSEEFTLGHNKFTIVKKADGALYISHKGTNNAVLNTDQLYWCDDRDYDKKEDAVSGANISFTQGDKDKPLLTSETYTVLCVKENNQEFYFDNE